MSIERAPSDDRGQARDEAAAWFAAMRGPEADTRRGEFETWLASSAMHRNAYNRISETFGLGKLLKERRPHLPRRPVRQGAGRGAILVAFLLLGIGLAAGRWMSPAPLAKTMLPPVSDVSGNDRPYQVAAASVLTTRVGEVRRINLSDGSLMILDTDSLATVAYGPSIRFIRLERGRARFEVADDRRAFQVEAGAGTITARSTTFDARVGSDNSVSFQVLSGTADLRPAGRRPELRLPAVTRLLPGQGVVWQASVSTIPAPTASAASDWPAGSVDFDSTPLADIIEQANRYSPVHIVLGDPGLRATRISGTFRINDPEILAQRLAEILDLETTRTTNEQLVLTRR